MKTAKDIFRNTELCLNFACYGRNYQTFSNIPDYYYVKHNVKGIIIAASYMHNRELSPLLSFNVIKQTDITPEIKKEFEQRFLPEYYKLYIEKLNSKILIPKTTVLLTELYDGKLKLHKFDI